MDKRAKTKHRACILTHHTRYRTRYVFWEEILNHSEQIPTFALAEQFSCQKSPTSQIQGKLRDKAVVEH